MKKLFIFFIASILILFFILLINTWLHVPAERERYSIQNIDLDTNSIVQHLSEALQFQTVSTQAITTQTVSTQI